jgi:hypothetical protein
VSMSLYVDLSWILEVAERAVAQVGYRFWDGNSWEWTTRNLAKAPGGQGDRCSHDVHSLVSVKDLVVRACTANSSGLVSCSAWK